MSEHSKEKSQEIQSRAKKIAKQVIDAEPEDRGYIFLQVAEELSKSSQHYTGSLFRSMGLVYNRQDGDRRS